MEQKVKIVWEDKPAEIVMRDITWKEKIECTKKAMVEVQKGRKIVKEFDQILHKQLLMLQAMKEAPFEKTMDNIDKLSSKDGEKVYATYARMNEVGDEGDEEG